MPYRHTSAFVPHGRQDVRGPDAFVLPDAPATTTPHDLSPRQHAVVALYAHGAPFKAIERTLGIGHQTVKTHLKFARAKAGVETNRELPAWYFGYTPYSALTEAGVPLPPPTPFHDRRVRPWQHPPASAIPWKPPTPRTCAAAPPPPY